MSTSGIPCQVIERRDDNPASRPFAHDNAWCGVEPFGPQRPEADDGDVAAVVRANLLRLLKLRAVDVHHSHRGLFHILAQRTEREFA
jgi:hypothetical protein